MTLTPGYRQAPPLPLAELARFDLADLDRWRAAHRLTNGSNRLAAQAVERFPAIERPERLQEGR